MNFTKWQGCGNDFVLIDCRAKELADYGAFAQKAAMRACAGMPVKFSSVIHPSPASPLANKGWAENATAALLRAGVWK